MLPSGQHRPSRIGLKFGTTTVALLAGRGAPRPETSPSYEGSPHSCCGPLSFCRVIEF